MVKRRATFREWMFIRPLGRAPTSVTFDSFVGTRPSGRYKHSNLERLSTARQAGCNPVLLELGGSIPSLSTNPVGPARRGRRTVNPHAAGSIPAAGATALWCQWLAWLSVEQQDGDRNPVGPPNIFCLGRWVRNRLLQGRVAVFNSLTRYQGECSGVSELLLQGD